MARQARPRVRRRAQSANGASASGTPEPSQADVVSNDDRFADDCDILLANGPVDERLYSGIIREITSQSELSRTLVLCLVTYGGVANDGYRIGKLVQSVYDDVAIFIPSFCKSAGTLIACSGNSLVMTPFGELGPLDVQILKRDELFERRSGLITKHALEELKGHSFELFQHFMLQIKARGVSISFKMASEIAAKITSDIMEDVYSQINVDAIGEDARNLAVASEYCERLDKRFNNLKSECVQRLVHGYVSHDFVIDMEEAETLFNRVERPTKTLYRLLQERQKEMMVPRSGEPIVKMLTQREAIKATHLGEGDNDEHELPGAQGVPTAEGVEDSVHAPQE